MSSYSCNATSPAPFLAGFAFRDNLLPDANWRAIFHQLRRELTSDEVQTNGRHINAGG